MLVQFLYVSKRSKNCTDTEIEKILASSVKNNQEIGASGLLLYSETKFMQYVESDILKIKLLYEKIKTDSRHYDIFLLSFSLIKERIFSDWHMAGKTTSEDNIEYISNITKEEKMVYDNVLEGSEETGKKIQRLLQKFL